MYLSMLKAPGFGGPGPGYTREINQDGCPLGGDFGITGLPQNQLP